MNSPHINESETQYLLYLEAKHEAYEYMKKTRGWNQDDLHLFLRCNGLRSLLDHMEERAGIKIIIIEDQGVMI